MWSDLIRFLWIIISLSLSSAFIAYIIKDITYKPVYRIETTYYVTSRGINNDLLTNMSTAQNMATRYAQIFTSTTIKRKAAETIGVSEDDFIISSEVITDTNLVVIRITADTPELVFKITKCVRELYPELSQYLVTDAIINELTPLKATKKPTYEIDLRITMIKAFILAFGILLILVLTYSCLRDTIRSGKDIEKKLDTRFLGEICFERKKRKIRNGNQGKEALLINKQTVSFRYAEAVGKTCRKIINYMNRDHAKTILITSCFENEGKTTIIANIALAMADQGKRVMLIDFDLKRPSLYMVFGVEKDSIPGLGELLKRRKVSDWTPFKIPDTNIYGIFNYNEYQNSTELLSGNCITDIIEELKEAFDYILIDTPPVNACADAETIAAIVDEYIIVVKEHLATAKQVNDVLDVFYNCPGYVIGCVLNATHNNNKHAVGGRAYSQKYGYYYNYDYYNKHYN